MKYLTFSIIKEIWYKVSDSHFNFKWNKKNLIV